MKTTEEMRALLVSEIEMVRAGKSKPERLRAMAQAANTIVRSKALDMDWSAAVRDNDGQDFAPVRLT